MTVRESFPFQLARRRSVWLPTWRGWLLMVLLLAAACLVFLQALHPFLAVNGPLPSAEVLVVEGWMPDYGFEAAAREFRRGSYHSIAVVGLPLEKGSYLSRLQNYADIGRETLIAIGIAADSVVAVQAASVRRDRTYSCAASVTSWLRERNPGVHRINVMTIGTHARRSRLTYEKALPPNVGAGVVAIRDRSYEADSWWRSSYGLRSTIYEMLAYLYTRFFFRI